MWLFRARLSPEEQAQVNRTRSAVNSVLDSCRSDWDRFRKEIAPTHNLLTDYLKRGIDWDGDADAVRALRDAVVGYRASLEQNFNEFTAHQLAEFFPKKVCKSYEEIEQYGFKSQFMDLAEVERALEPSANLRTEPAFHRMNVAVSGLNMAASGAVVIRKTRL